MNAINFIQQLDQNFEGIVEAGFVHESEYKNVVNRSGYDPEIFESIIMRVFYITMDPDKKIKYFINQYDNGLFLYLVEISTDTWLFVLSSNAAFAKMHFFVKYVSADGGLDMTDLANQVKDVTVDFEGVDAAKRIQNLLFENPEPLMKDFSSASLWYAPKFDIGGDFYWGKRTKDSIWIVIGDCTGHSVEGALASVSILSILNQVFNDQAKPHNLIKNIHSSLENIQKQKLEDGYGIGNEMLVIKYDLSKHELYFSGTGIALYVKRKKVQRFKTKKAMYEPDRVIKFLRSKKLQIEKGDELLIFSDGITDQLNSKQKRLRTSALEETFETESGMQPANIKTMVEKWKGNEPQTDDMIAFYFKR